MKERNTNQKRFIIEALSSLNHPSADDIYNYIHKDYPKISRATIYRNLTEMVSRNLVKRIRINDEQAYFDLSVDNHYHLKCNKCNKLIDIMVPYQNNLDEKAKEYCQIDNHEIIFSGTCLDCIKIIDERKK